MTPGRAADAGEGDVVERGSARRGRRPGLRPTSIMRWRTVDVGDALDVVQRVQLDVGDAVLRSAPCISSLTIAREVVGEGERVA